MAKDVQKIVQKYEQIVSNALTDLCMDFEIIGYIALNVGGVKVTADDDIALGYTDFKHIYLSAPYADRFKLNKEHIKFLIAHEVFHILLLHDTRLVGPQYNYELANKAQDYAINSLLINDEMKLKGKIVGEFIEHGCYDTKYINWSSEQIYKDLIKNKDKNQQDPIIFRLDKHLDPKDVPNENVREAMIRVSGIIEQMKNSGQLSNALSKFLNEIPKPKENWRYILDKYIKSFMKAETSWKSPKRRYMANSLYYPNKHNTPKLNVAIGIDTSGSINTELLSKFLGHIFKILKSYDTFEVQIFCWSTIAHEDTYKLLNEKTYKQFNPKDHWIKSNGGTIAQSSFDFVKSLKKKPDCFINFTDGYFENNITGFKTCPVLFAIGNNVNNGFKIPKGLTRARKVTIQD